MQSFWNLHSQMCVSVCSMWVCVSVCCHVCVCELHLCWCEWLKAQRGASWIISAEASWLGLAGSPHDVIVERARPECVCESVCMHSDVCTVCARAGLCVCVCVCVCACVCSRLLPPTGWSFTFRTGRRDSEAARLRPEPGYSAVSNARHSLAPPELSALSPNARSLASSS